jgi:ABC-type uncharacterized transport system permease subunit
MGRDASSARHRIRAMHRNVSLAIRAIWCSAVAVLIAMLLAADSILTRSWFLTVLAWSGFPSSFAAAPLANAIAGTFDFENVKVIDFNVSVWMGVAGYLQWFCLIPWLRRAVR